MKVLAWVFGGFVGVVLAVVIVERMAAERVEVIEVHGIDPDGSIVTTRLWIVDDQDGMYVRVGADGSGWFSRMQANPDFDMTRGDVTQVVTAIPEPGKSEAINRLMQEKYTWGDSFIGSLVGGREGSIPIRLQPQ